MGKPRLKNGGNGSGGDRLGLRVASEVYRYEVTAVKPGDGGKDSLLDHDEKIVRVWAGLPPDQRFALLVYNLTLAWAHQLGLRTLSAEQAAKICFVTTRSWAGDLLSEPAKARRLLADMGILDRLMADPP